VSSDHKKSPYGAAQQRVNDGTAIERDLRLDVIPGRKDAVENSGKKSEGGPG
jgi:hypothetical protein